MRLVLFTGKGGVGKTTAAAATARAGRGAAAKTLVVSTDPAHSLADALGRAARPGEPDRVGRRCYALQVDARAAVRGALARAAAAGSSSTGV